MPRPEYDPRQLFPARGSVFETSAEKFLRGFQEDPMGGLSPQAGPAVGVLRKADYGKFGSAVVRWARRYGRSPQEREDLAQSGFRKILETAQVKGVNPEDLPLPTGSGIARQAMLNEIRGGTPGMFVEQRARLNRLTQKLMTKEGRVSDTRLLAEYHKIQTAKEHKATLADIRKWKAGEAETISSQTPTAPGSKTTIEDQATLLAPTQQQQALAEAKLTASKQKNLQSYLQGEEVNPKTLRDLVATLKKQIGPTATGTSMRRQPPPISGGAGYPGISPTAVMRSPQRSPEGNILPSVKELYEFLPPRGNPWYAPRVTREINQAGPVAEAFGRPYPASRLLPIEPASPVDPAMTRVGRMSPADQLQRLQELFTNLYFTQGRN